MVEDALWAWSLGWIHVQHLLDQVCEEWILHKTIVITSSRFLLQVSSQLRLIIQNLLLERSQCDCIAAVIRDRHAKHAVSDLVPLL